MYLFCKETDQGFPSLLKESVMKFVQYTMQQEWLDQHNDPYDRTI